MSELKYIIGCSGFILPKERYFSVFRAVEVTEFYLSLIKESTAKKWLERTRKDAIFCLVAPKWIVETPTERERSTILRGDYKNYGEFKLTDANLDLYERLYKVARVLNSPTILFITPASWGPDRRNKEKMYKFFTTVPREDVEIVWEPRGIWTKAELERISKDLNISISFDPVREVPKVFRSPYYARITPLSSFSRQLTIIQWESLMENLASIKEGTVYIFFGNQGALNDAKRLIQRLNLEG